jgi:serine acetyltransferase
LWPQQGCTARDHRGTVTIMSLQHQTMRRLIALSAIALPQPAKKLIYRVALGWEIDKTAHIGFSIISATFVHMDAEARIGSFNLINVDGTLEMGSSSSIVSFNVVRGCELVQIGSHACIGFGNWISGPPLSTGLFPNSPDRAPIFRLGEHASVVRNHRIECSDAVTIGRFTTIGGTRTEILTHGIDVRASVQRTGAVEIGEYCYFGSNVMVQSGSRVAPRTVVAPRAVVQGSLGSSEELIGGVPARTIKSLAGALYFHRKRGEVD